MFVFDDIFKLPQETIDQIFGAIKGHETLGDELAKALKPLHESRDKEGRNLARHFGKLARKIDNKNNIQKSDTIAIVSENGPLMATLPFFYIVSPTFVKKHMSEGPYGAMGDYASNHMIKGNDAGSGPYILKKFQSDVGYDLTRNNDYWGGWTADKVYGFHFMKVAEESTHKQMFAAGLAHITGSFKSTEFVKWVDATDGMEVEYQHKPINPHFIFMNTTNPPFDDKNFRKAMAHIFPYTDFLDNIRGSIGDKRMTGPLTRAFWGHNEDLTRYEEDMAKAKSLIAASKYADTSAIREIN